MKNFSTLVAGIGLATTMALTVQSSAQAYKFNFNFDPNPSEPYTASGFFDIDDTLGSIPGEVEFGTELTDYEINMFDSGSLVDTINPSTNRFPLSNNTITGVKVSSTELNFSTASDGNLLFHSGPSGIVNFYLNPAYTSLYPDSEFGESTSTNSLATISTQPAPATAVPFGVKTDLSILILGGLYGASRLRKVLTARSK